MSASSKDYINRLPIEVLLEVFGQTQGVDKRARQTQRLVEMHVCERWALIGRTSTVYVLHSIAQVMALTRLLLADPVRASAARGVQIRAQLHWPLRCGDVEPIRVGSEICLWEQVRKLLDVASEVEVVELLPDVHREFNHAVDEDRLMEYEEMSMAKVVEALSPVTKLRELSFASQAVPIDRRFCLDYSTYASSRTYSHKLAELTLGAITFDSGFYRATLACSISTSPNATHR